MNVDESSLLAVERQQIILTMLQRNGIVRNNELKDLLNVSIATIRADLRELENNGVCEIVWGGALAKNRLIRETSPDTATEVTRDFKRRIGQRAAQCLEDGQTIIVDAGSTTVELIHHISNDIEDLRLITPGLNIAVAVAQYPHIELIVTGGILRHLTRVLIGAQVTNVLQTVNADWVFLATGGFSVEHGITTSNALEADVKRSMAERASKIVVMADSSKYGKALSINVLPMKSIDLLITDTLLSDDAASQISECGVEVLRV